MNEHVTAESRYNALATAREPFLLRGRECAKYTIPALLPPEGHNGTSSLYTPYQSLGARGVNQLASKLLLTLLPPSSSFFRLVPDDKVKQQLEDDQRSALDLTLSQIERSVISEIEQRAVRVQTFEAFKHLIVSGNALLHIPSTGLRVFPLHQYVAKRDPEGNLLEIIVKECVSPSTLPDDIREMLEQQQKSSPEQHEKPAKTVDLYTRVQLDTSRNVSRWKVHQEVKGIVIDKTRGTYPKDKCPWLPLRWTRIDGEDYGRGLCEEYLGDLISLEALNKAIVEFAAIAAKVVILVKPNGQTRMDTIVDAPNGAVREGEKEDVGVVGMEKFPDFQVAKGVLDEIAQRLSYAFLMNSAIQRNGERVTAEEIRYMAGELEDALGGVYSVFSQEFQLPLVRLIMGQLQRTGTLPTLPEKLVRPTIVTGIDALGRSHELMRLDTAIGGALKTFGPEAVAAHLNMSDYLTRRFTALGIDPKGLIIPPEVIAQRQQAAMQQQMVERLGPPAIQASSKLAATPTQGPTE